MVKTLIKYELVINRALRSALMYDTAEQQINEFISFLGRQIGSDRAARFSGYSALAKIYISMHYINVQTHSFHIIKASDSVQQMVGKIASLDSRYTAEEDFCAHADAVLHAFCR